MKKGREEMRKVDWMSKLKTDKKGPPMPTPKEMREPRKVLEELCNKSMDDMGYAETHDVDIDQALSELSAYYKSQEGRKLPCEHLVCKTKNGKITELYIEGEEWIRKSQEVKRLGVEGIYDVIMQVMKKYLLNKKSNWNVVPVKEIAQAIYKAQEAK